MPKSKRNKVVALTKVKKKDKDWKDGLITRVRQHVDEYPSIYLFRYENMRNDKLKELREELKDSSKFVMGANKKLQVALGKTPSEEYRNNLHQLAERIHGFVGLFFTKLPRDEVETVFNNFQHEDFARPGSRASQTFSLLAGPVEGSSGPMPHTVEPTLRKHGMPTKLNKGVVELIADYDVCKEGQVLSSDQAALLRQFGVKMAVFKMQLLAVWHDDEVEIIAEHDGTDEGEEGGDGVEDEEGGDDVAADGLTANMMLPPGV